MSRSKAGLRTAALFGLLLSGAAGSGCNHAITGTEERLPSPPPPTPPAPLAIVPGTLELVVGQSAQLRTSGGDASSLFWASSDSSVVSVSASGMVTAGRTGTASIIAGNGNDCAFSSGRALQVKGAPGSGSNCAIATIFVHDRKDRDRQ